MLLFCIHPMMSAAKVTSNISKLMTSLKLMLFTPFPLLSIRKIMKRGSTAYRYWQRRREYQIINIHVIYRIHYFHQKINGKM